MPDTVEFQDISCPTCATHKGGEFRIEIILICSLPFVAKFLNVLGLAGCLKSTGKNQRCQITF